MDGSPLLAVVLLCLVPVASFAAPLSFAERLSEADNSRSSDPERFAVLLDELEAAQGGAEPSLVQHLQFLRAYQNVVYRNQVEEGIAQARVLFDEAMEHDLRFRAGTFLANTFGATREFDEGLRILNRALPMRDRVGNREWRDAGLISVALFYNQLGQHGLALQYANEVLQGAPPDELRCVAGLSVLQAQYGLGTLPADDAPAHESIAQCLAAENTMAANFQRLVLARRWSERGEKERAIGLLEKHLDDADAVGYFRLKADFLALLAVLRLEKGDLEAAQAYAHAAVAGIDPLQSPPASAMANEVLFRVAERRGRPAEALVFFQRYAEADKAHLNEIKARELAYETVRNEVLHNRQKIQLLSQQNALLNLQQRVQRQAYQNMGLVVVLLGLLVAGVGYWAYKLSRRADRRP